MKLSAPAFALKTSVQGVLQFSQSGRYLAQVTSRVLIWDVPTRKQIAAIKAISNEHYVAFDNNADRIAIKSSNGELAFCEIASGETISSTGKFKQFRMGCQPMFSQDGAYLLDGHWQGRLLLWEASSAKLVHQWDLGASAVNDIHYCPATQQYACSISVAGGTRIAILRDLRSGAAPRLLDAQDFGVDPDAWWEVNAIRFSPCGKQLAIAARTQNNKVHSRLYLLDLENPKLMYSRQIGHVVEGWVSRISWSDDGHIAAVFQENPWRQGMKTPEYEALKASRVWEFVEVYAAASGELIQSTALLGVNRATFAPGSNAIALNCTQSPGAFLASFRDIPAFAASQSVKKAPR